MTLEKIEQETDRDNYLSPQQAIDMGLIDNIIDKSSPSKISSSGLEKGSFFRESARG